MRPSRPLAALLLLASLALAGCGLGGTKTAAAPAASAAGPAAAPAPIAATPAAAVAKTSPCAWTRSWGTGAKQSPRYSVAPLYLIRVGQHPCYDRVVFDINSPDPVGYHVQYVKVVLEDGSGIPRPVAGGAALEVIVHAPAKGADNQGHQPGVNLAKPGQDFYTAAQLRKWRSLREIRYAGSFEGQTTIAVGVRARTPFRVFTLVDSRNQIMRVVLDVAHNR
jgi:hypothetical protein